MAYKGKPIDSSPRREPTVEVTITWDTEDVLVQLREEAGLHSDIELSLSDDAMLPAFCGRVLDDLLHKHDADVGINWNVLGNTIRFQPDWQEMKKRLNPPKQPLSVCATCERSKTPIGRDLPAGAGDSFCTYENCEGYSKPPEPTTDWP